MIDIGPNIELRPEDLEDFEIVSFNKVLRSGVRDFAKCKRKFWYVQRKGYDSKYEKSSSVIDLFKELVCVKTEKLSLPKEERKGKNVMSSNEIVDKLKEYDVSVQKDARRLTRFFGVRKFMGEKDTLLGTNVWVEATLPNNFMVKGKIDIVILKDDVFLGEYINVIIPTLSFGFSDKKDDPESLFLAFLAYKKFGMNVAVTKVSANTPDTQTSWFIKEEDLDSEDDEVYAIEDLEDIIYAMSEKMKDVAESDEIPFPESSSHCNNCQFLKKCFRLEADKDKIKDKTVDELKALITLSQEMIKGAKQELITNFEELGKDEIKLYDGTSVKYSQSVTFAPKSDEIEGRVTKTKLVDELEGPDFELLKSVGGIQIGDLKNETIRKNLKKIFRKKGIDLEFSTSTRTNITIK